MFKKVNIGNSDGIILENDIKTKIIDYLYDKIDLHKYRYLILNKIETLIFLQENEHFVSPNYKGYNYLLLFLTLYNKHYCVFIDRRKLSYHRNQLDMKTIQIIQLHIKTTESIFRGTIFDGKLIQKNNEYIFLIQDYFYLMGNKTFDMEINQKFIHLDIILKNHFKNEDNEIYCKNFEFKLNKIYKYNELEELIYNTIPKLTIPLNGLIFFPKYSGINILYIDKKVEIPLINNNNAESVNNKSYDIINNYINYLKNKTYNYENININKIKKFWLTKTNIPDVYYISDTEISDKLGIALIPNLKTSYMCDELINDKPVQFNCIFSNKFKKWIPIKIDKN
jgi:hypothetical protein